VESCNVFDFPAFRGVTRPTQLHSVQVNDEKPARIGMQFSIYNTWLEQKMNEIKVPMVGATVV